MHCMKYKDCILSTCTYFVATKIHGRGDYYQLDIAPPFICKRLQLNMMKYRPGKIVFLIPYTYTHEKENC